MANKTLVLGASGATGRLLVKKLLEQGNEVIVIVRSKENFLKHIPQDSNLQIVEGEISKFSKANLAKYIIETRTIFSCLGHNLSFKGIFGKPRRLVTDAVKSVFETLATIEPKKKIKFILMNTSGNCNHDEQEEPPLSQRLIVFLLRYLIPPHADNECAANFLRLDIGKNHEFVEWVAVRPDTLIDEENTSKYKVFPSPIRNVIFNSGKTSRMNVADFMSKLHQDHELWNKWVGKMPVIYNSDSSN